MKFVPHVRQLFLLSVETQRFVIDSTKLWKQDKRTSFIIYSWCKNKHLVIDRFFTVPVVIHCSHQFLVLNFLWTEEKMYGKAGTKRLFRVMTKGLYAKCNVNCILTFTMKIVHYKTKGEEKFCSFKEVV